MEIDDYVALAIRLGEQLKDVDRNEWKKWAEYVQREGSLERALLLAQQLSQSPMLRSLPRQAYRKIGEVIRQHKSTLTRLPTADLYQVLGFIGWHLVGRLGLPLEGRLRIEDAAKVHKGTSQAPNRKRQRAR
jgi:hypothetical protein